MIAVILAGGKGSRLTPFTNDVIPKPMAILNGKPILQHQIESLSNDGIRDFVLVVGHLKEKIIDFFGDGANFKVNIEYFVEEMPLGTAGCFYFLKEKIKEDFFLVFGDTIFDIDLKRMKQFHDDKNADATLFVHPNNHPFDSDIVVLDSDDRILQFDSKNNIRNYYYKNCVNAGFYIIKNKILNIIESNGKYDLEKDIFIKFIDTLRIYAYQSSEYIKDVGTVERLEQASVDLENGIVSAKNLKRKQKAIFIDRDGTLNMWKGLIKDADEIELLPNAANAVKLANKSDYLVILITNQPVIARNLCSIETLEHMHKKIETLLGKEGAYLDGIYYCPHHPDKGYPEENKEYKIECNCRKPKIGMLIKCQSQFNIDFTKSWFVGDTTIDVKTGENAGLKTVLLQTGEAGNDKKFVVKPDAVKTDLLDAFRFIL